MAADPCDYCKGSKIPGIHFPTDFDDREESRDGKVFISKCDASCIGIADDTEAAEEISKLTGWPVMRSYDRDDDFDPKSRAEKVGTEYYRPYFAVTLKEAEKLHD